LYNWTTYPLTCLLEHIWKIGSAALARNQHPEPTLVELCSASERALNFMHTGNVSVIATSAMNPLWIGLSIIHDGLPCLNPTIIPTLSSTLMVNTREWPRNTTQQPMSASKCAQIRTYSEGQYNVSFYYFVFILCPQVEAVRPAGHFTFFISSTCFHDIITRYTLAPRILSTCEVICFHHNYTDTFSLLRSFTPIFPCRLSPLINSLRLFKTPMKN
jgi:hypothetical protein